MAKDILLITPPFTQLNTPYPATVYLKGFLNTKKIKTYKIVIGIELKIAFFSKKSLINLLNNALEKNSITYANSQSIYDLKKSYL